MRIQKLLSVTVLAASLAMAGGCSLIGIEEVSYAPPMPVPPEQLPATDGAVYRANGDVRLFEDFKAGRVGDILTVKLVENTNASKNAATSVAKSTEATIANPTAFGVTPTYDGTPMFEGSLSGDSTFDGSGTSTQSNSLVGDITVTVVERLANGNLVIRGEKWVTLNQGREFIQLSGIVRPRDIGTDNTLMSTRIANAQISYSSKGVLADANRMGFVARFFNSIFSPY
ncbi:MAG: flagellar basal body L-ring protein FlgH [Pseudomonadota bacterium]